MRNLELAGVNIAQLYVQNNASLPQTPYFSDADWNAYIGPASKTYQTMTWGPAGSYDSQPEAYANVLFQIATSNGIQNVTPSQLAQQDVVLLTRLQALKAAGMICGNVQFVIVDRHWFPDQTTVPPPAPGTLEQQWADTATSLITAVDNAALDSWLAGVMLSEAQTHDMNQYLPIALDLATRLNAPAETNGWLKSHLLIIAGGGNGDEFNGINSVICPSGSGYQFVCTHNSALPFFNLMKQQTGTFSFAFKLFNTTGTVTPPEYCNEHPPCDPNNMTVNNWIAYLSDDQEGLGFSDLVTFVNANAATYPALANVMFIGDGEDHLKSMLTTSGTTVTAGPAFTALQTVFRNGAVHGGGWSGGMFMDTYYNVDIQPANLPDDNGSSLFFVNCQPYEVNSNIVASTGSLTQQALTGLLSEYCPGDVTANPQSQAFWNNWFTLGD
jgi:hypothetical protein